MIKFVKIIVGFVRKMRQEIAKGAAVIAEIFSNMMKFFVKVRGRFLKAIHKGAY